MNRSIALAGLFGFSVWAMSGSAFAQSPIACALIGEKEALSLVGEPLGEISKDERKPTPENAHDHTTSCRFLPKGYDFKKADRPPERGLFLELHAKRNNAEAKGFHESAVDMVEEMAKAPRTPFAGGKIATKIATLSGMGATAKMEVETIEFEPKAVYHVATVYFLKGNVSGVVAVWKKGAPADEIARAAAKQVIAKLP